MAHLNTEIWWPSYHTSGKGNGTLLQYSCPENPMDGGAWWAAVHEVAKSQTRLNDLTLTFHFHALEKEMATHSSVLAWRIPGTWEPSGLPSMGLHRVKHDWTDLAAVAITILAPLSFLLPFSSLFFLVCGFTQIALRIEEYFIPFAVRHEMGKCLWGRSFG